MTVLPFSLICDTASSIGESVDRGVAILILPATTTPTHKTRRRDRLSMKYPPTLNGSRLITRLIMSTIAARLSRKRRGNDNDQKDGCTEKRTKLTKKNKSNKTVTEADNSASISASTCRLVQKNHILHGISEYHTILGSHIYNGHRKLCVCSLYMVPSLQLHYIIYL